MERGSMTLKEYAVALSIETGVIPCVYLTQESSLSDRDMWIRYGQAMYEGGARIIEVSGNVNGHPEVKEAAIRALRENLGDDVLIASGTTLTAELANGVIDAGARVIVTPYYVKEVLEVANAREIPVFCGAFTGYEVDMVMKAGSAMVKLWPAAEGGPKAVSSFKMVLPPDYRIMVSGGVNLENCGEFIRCGASAVSGAHAFMNPKMVEKEGFGWVTNQVRAFMDQVAEAKKNIKSVI